ncbi:hypothetical protein CQA38_07540 [Campylobacter sp. MIT 12-5580]|uniref:hypothetical protein n=1 Tax=Campylobacter sp. MIT 12-5580 TaxID=2040651 RepID=UPI0010F6DFE6|nr:hypothetical protein [Campylobacter sp. MIT 12-5580]TKX28520.1 hypothetical protein CQA38_07540 [Campylobacter sp. MIT 12-5580]
MMVYKARKIILPMIIGLILTACSDPKADFVKEFTEGCKFGVNAGENAEAVCSCSAEFLASLFEEKDFELMQKYQKRMHIPQSEEELAEKSYIMQKMDYIIYTKNPPPGLKKKLEQFLKKCVAEKNKIS